MSIEINDHDALELRLFIDNDRTLYHGMYRYIALNLQRKIAKGTYDPEKAVKAWLCLVDAGAKKYIKEHCSKDCRMRDIFPKALRVKVAEDIANHFATEYALGNKIN